MEAQQQLLARQDVMIDHIGGQIDRIKTVAININTEIKSQNELINDVTLEVDAANSKLDAARAKTRELIDRANGCCTWWVVIGLAAVLVILILVLVLG